MNNKKIKKVIFTVLFLTIVMIINTTVVSAASKVGTCVYTLSKYTDEHKNTYENIQLKISMGTNSKFRSPMGITYNNGLIYAGTPTTDETGLLHYLNEQFFCPDKVYIEKCSNSTNGTIKFLTKLEVDDKTKCSKAMELTIDKGKVEGKVTVYTPQQKLNGEIEPCEKNSSVVVSEVKELVKLKEKIESANDNSLLTYSEELKKYNANKYCLDEDKKMLSDKINEIMPILNDKINNLKLDEKEKKELQNNYDDVNRQNGEVGELPNLQPVAFACSRLDPSLKQVLKLVLKWVRILVPIILIILVSIDFAQAVISQDQDAVKKATSKAIKRAIAALAVFFVPFLVSLMIDWFDRIEYDSTEIKEIDMNSLNCTEIFDDKN